MNPSDSTQTLDQSSKDRLLRASRACDRCCEAEPPGIDGDALKLDPVIDGLVTLRARQSLKLQRNPVVDHPDHSPTAGTKANPLALGRPAVTTCVDFDFSYIDVEVILYGLSATSATVARVLAVELDGSSRHERTPALHAAKWQQSREAEACGLREWPRLRSSEKVPEVASLAELNEPVGQWDRHDGRRRIGSRARKIDEYFEVERPLLMPLPEDPFETGRV